MNKNEKEINFFKRENSISYLELLLLDTTIYILLQSFIDKNIEIFQK